MSCAIWNDRGASFTPTGHLPGYGGFCPTMTQRCGITYGNATRLYHMQSREETLNTSRKSIRDSGWLGETTVIFTRPAPGLKNHWSQPFSYSLQSGQRREEIFQLNQHAQKRRNYYKDHSGGIERVPGISLKMHYSQTFTRLTPTVPPTCITPSTIMQSQKVKSHVHPPQGQTSARERAIRDIYFERR